MRRLHGEVSCERTFSSGGGSGRALFLWAASPWDRKPIRKAQGRSIAAFLEVHASSSPPVIAVVFHQRDKQDQAGLASLLLSRSGEKVEERFGEGEWVRVRLRGSKAALAAVCCFCRPAHRLSRTAIL